LPLIYTWRRGGVVAIFGKGRAAPPLHEGMPPPRRRRGQTVSIGERPPP
jgi:hypothetical protein